MRILVTGSSGTIGTRLCETLLAAGYDVLGIDWKENVWQSKIDAITVRADLRDPHACDAVKGTIDFVIHLAANARVHDLVEHPSMALDNAVTTFHTIEWARKAGVKGLIFASSREVYGNDQAAERYSENMVRITDTESPYSASKLTGEAFVHAYARCYGLQSIILRFSNVYGMYDDSNRVIPLWFRQARNNETLRVFGKDKCLDFTYIDDTVQGIIGAVQHFDEAKNDTYNLAYGEGVSLLTVAEDIRRLLGSASEIALESSRTGEVVRYVADITKAKEKLGYSPTTRYASGIEKAIEWYVNRAA